MGFWTRILTVPGMGGGVVLSVIGLWVLFLAGLVVWIVSTPQEQSGDL